MAIYQKKATKKTAMGSRTATPKTTGIGFTKTATPKKTSSGMKTSTPKTTGIGFTATSRPKTTTGSSGSGMMKKRTMTKSAASSITKPNATKKERYVK